MPVFIFRSPVRLNATVPVKPLKLTWKHSQSPIIVTKKFKSTQELTLFHVISSGKVHLP